MTSLVAFAGGPINLSEAEAAVAADAALIATICEIEVVPQFGPFEIGERVESETGEPFAQVATVTKFKILLGTVPETVKVYGGKVGAKTDFRLDPGESLLLLKKIAVGCYRAVDWDYGLMPIRNGEVEWTITRLPRKTEWITIDEALRRIKAHRTQSEEAAESDDGKLPK